MPTYLTNQPSDHRNNDPRLSPSVDRDYLEGIKSTREVQTTGSYTNNRKGPLRGSPDVTWWSFDDKLKISDITTQPLSSEEVYTCHIQGHNLLLTQCIYLSASNDLIFSLSAEDYNPFKNSSPRISEENPIFTGIKLDTFKILSDTRLTFNLHTVLAPGTLDIILQGPAGYFMASNAGYTESYASQNYINIHDFTAISAVSTLSSLSALCALSG